MKLSKIISKGLFTLLVLSITFPILAQKDFTKEVNRTFNIGDNGRVAIFNKYGTVNVRTGNSSEAIVDVTILVKSKKESQADEVFEKIEIDFDEQGNSVEIETNINSSSTWWNRWWKSNDAEFEINYEVQIPKSTMLKIHNKYGDISVSDLTNDLEIDLKYGNLFLSTITGDLELNLAYGSATAESLDELDGQISYSDKFSVKRIKSGNLETKYSKLFIDEAGDLEIESKYDQYKLGTVGNIENEGKYDDFQIKSARSLETNSRNTNFNIGHLERSANFEITYGSINIDEISPTFTDINLECKYVAITLDIQSEFLFEIESKYTDIDLPSDAYIMEKEDNENYMKGYMGSKNAKAEVNAELSYGSLKLK